MATTASVSKNDNDMNIVERWLRVDTVRWISGVLAGLLAGGLAIFVAMVFAKIGGREFWYPVKLMASILMGPGATALDSGLGAIVAGLIFFEGLAAFLGLVYAHFTVTNNAQALLGVGLTWAAFSWIFIWNLFFQSFSTIFVAALSSGVVFPICLVYGLSLSSVGFFDRALRGAK